MMAHTFFHVVSQLCGWVYTLCWSLSFYPQPILNLRRLSTTGTTIDFPMVNVFGFLAYFVSNAAFLYSKQIRADYALRHRGLTPTVQINDLAFAGHAVLITALTLSQFVPSLWGFQKRAKGPDTRPSKGILGILVGSFLGVGIVIIIVVARHDQDPKTGWAWIDVVMTNYRNQSTYGWSIGQILLDFVGGILSLLQLGIDSYLQGDWSGVTGNPVKLALGNISIFFDLIFMTQHYCLYRGKVSTPEEEGLLDNERL